MRAFIVRPFGAKDVQIGGARHKIDFDRVEEQLILPALNAIGIQGGTTTEIVEQGNIREDMFRMLVTAELVLADVSIHNANVFYELGIRHGLRAQDTFLLRANLDKYPFDLATDRYLVYDTDDPAATVKELTRALRATLVSKRVDSPVYQVLPSLRPPDPSDLHVVPRDFVEAVDRSRSSRYRGDLRILAYEARDFEWGVEGLRTVGRAQVKVQAWRGAKETFEWLLELRQEDVEANQKLAEIYQKLSELEEPHARADCLARSSQAIQRVIDVQGTTRTDRAEAHALQGRNIKARWVQRFAKKPTPEARAIALRSPGLTEALEAFASGFQQDLNHFSSGVNAMSLLRIRLDLASAPELREVWLDMFDDEEDAAFELTECESQFRQLSGAVALSLQASRNALQKQWNPNPDEQLKTALSEASVAFLTGHRPRTAAQRYREALIDATTFSVGAVREQLAIFDQLQVRPEFVKEVSAALDEASSAIAPDTASTAAILGRVILFTGHMIDRPGRSTPRFPPTTGAEREARRLIDEAVGAECQDETGTVVGVAGGACGGDLLFHEVCESRGIRSQVYLPLPKGPFAANSVQHGGAKWVERYERLLDHLKTREMSNTTDLPPWLQGRDYSIWHRHNLWLLFNALSMNAHSLTLIALWDEGEGDGTGGTRDLVGQVTARGYKVVRLPAERLKDL